MYNEASKLSEIYNCVDFIINVHKYIIVFQCNMNLSIMNSADLSDVVVGCQLIVTKFLPISFYGIGVVI